MTASSILEELYGSSHLLIPKQGTSPDHYARVLLGKQVRAVLENHERHAGRTVITEGQLLEISNDGEFTIVADDGSIHWCWPLLAIEPREQE